MALSTPRSFKALMAEGESTATARFLTLAAASFRRGLILERWTDRSQPARSEAEVMADSANLLFSSTIFRDDEGK